MRKLPLREYVFIRSLIRHGYKVTYRRSDFKLRRGYVVPSTLREDGMGIDFWVKVPNDARLYPIQITQRGIKIFRLLEKPTVEQLANFVVQSDARIASKQYRCQRDGVAFVLVRDYLGASTNQALARRDLSALHYGLAELRRYR